MSRKSLDQTLGFMQEIDRAASPDAICAVLIGAARRFGFEHVLAGTIPGEGAGRSQQIAHVLLADWPEEWARRYFSHGYLFADPAIKRVRDNRGPFLWSELEPDCAENAAARRVMAEAGEFRLREGLTVPMVTLEGESVGLSLAGERIDVSPAARGALTLLATYALSGTLRLAARGAHAPGPRLSARERDALQWAAEGRTECEIAEQMTITKHGVDKHMRSARGKLGARNRTHAVAQAIRLGLVR